MAEGGVDAKVAEEGPPKPPKPLGSIGARASLVSLISMSSLPKIDLQDLKPIETSSSSTTPTLTAGASSTTTPYISTGPLVRTISGIDGAPPEVPEVPEEQPASSPAKTPLAKPTSAIPFLSLEGAAWKENATTDLEVPFTHSDSPRDNLQAVDPEQLECMEDIPRELKHLFGVASRRGKHASIGEAHPRIVSTAELEDEVSETLTMMSIEMQLLANEATAPGTTSTSGTTSTKSPNLETTGEADSKEQETKEYKEGKRSSGGREHGLMGRMFNFVDKWKQEKAEAAAVARYTAEHKKKKNESDMETLQENMHRKISLAKELVQRTGLLKSYDYGPQLLFFNERTSIRKQFPWDDKVEIEKVMNDELVDRFVKKWFEFKRRYTKPSQSAVTMVFHATSSENLPSILQTGLVVPEDGVAMKNDAQFGRGIYVSPLSTVSHAYCEKEDHRILVCAALLGKTSFPGTYTNVVGYDSNVVGNLIILYTSTQILPLYLVKCHCGGHKPDRPDDSLDYPISPSGSAPIASASTSHEAQPGTSSFKPRSVSPPLAVGHRSSGHESVKSWNPFRRQHKPEEPDPSTLISSGGHRANRRASVV